jgi:hypothetical protein
MCYSNNDNDMTKTEGRGFVKYNVRWDNERSVLELLSKEWRLEKRPLADIAALSILFQDTVYIKILIGRLTLTDFGLNFISFAKTPDS